MPELSEVENSLRGIEPYIIQQKLLTSLYVKLAYAGQFQGSLKKILDGHILHTLICCGKYILLMFEYF